MTEPLLAINNLQVSVGDKTILRGIDLSINPGEIHVIMGPNGSGKSTLALSLLGHPSYMVTEGSIQLKGVDITNTSVDERARMGMFLSFQYPTALPGVSVGNFLRLAYDATTTSKKQPFRALLYSEMEKLAIDKQFAARYMNDGFSGGEKKRFEMLQMQLLQPDLAVIDEVDSGLDIDALQLVSRTLNNYMNKKRGMLIITHYDRILEHVQANVVHVMQAGKIVRSGDKSLSQHLEKYGYNKMTDELEMMNNESSTNF